MTGIIRRTLAIPLLYVIWKHAHWSVALAITLIGVGLEVLSFSVFKLMEALRK